MWKSKSFAAATSHLFVHQSGDWTHDASNETEPSSDSGYADSTQCSSSARSGTPEPIYYSTSDIAGHGGDEKNKSHYDAVLDKMVELQVSEPAVPADVEIAEEEVAQLETFYRGHKTHVYVCKSLANLYLRSSRTLVGLTRYSSQPDILLASQERQADSVSSWELHFTGVPVLLHDLGATKSRDRRRIQIVVAERGTGFALWRDTIDNLSNYEVAGPAFHTMRLSTDHRLIAGLSFDSPEAARHFYGRLDALTSDPANICLSLPKKTNGKRRFGRFWSTKLRPSSKATNKKKCLRKSDISMPCFFQHVTAVEATDQAKFFSLQAFIV